MLRDSAIKESRLVGAPSPIHLLPSVLTPHKKMEAGLVVDRWHARVHVKMSRAGSQCSISFVTGVLNHASA